MKEKTPKKYVAPVDFGKEVSLRQQFVTLVAENPDLTKEQKDKIIGYGLSALKKEEVSVCD